MTEAAALFILCAFFATAYGASLFFHSREAAAWRAERADLLNRLMAQDWGQYVLGRAPATSDTPQLLSDEDEAKWHNENKRAHPEQYPDETP